MKKKLIKAIPVILIIIAVMYSAIQLAINWGKPVETAEDTFIRFGPPVLLIFIVMFINMWRSR